jgi:hypothetical protein
MFGREPRLPVDVMNGISRRVVEILFTAKYVNKMREKLLTADK